MAMTNQQLTETTGVWQPATDLQKMQALILLAKLPMRSPSDLAVVKAVYLIALEGVAAFGLEQATKAILRGSLGHPFMPSPPELRMECERIMDSEREAVANAMRQERLAAEQPPPPPVHSPEEIARQHERMQRFYNQHDEAKADLQKQFPKPDPPRKFEPRPRYVVNPPDWLDGEPLQVTPALLKLLNRQAENEEKPA
jgi:hypothetical protein